MRQLKFSGLVRMNGYKLLYRVKVDYGAWTHLLVSPLINWLETSRAHLPISPLIRRPLTQSHPVMGPSQMHICVKALQLRPV